MFANVDALMHGFAVALTFDHVVLMVLGVLLGILVGVLPGLGAPNGVTLLLPLTFSMDPVSAIILLTSTYWGALFDMAPHLLDPRLGPQWKPTESGGANARVRAVKPSRAAHTAPR